MNILAIVGSPHSGNTVEITERLGAKLREMGPVDFRLVELRKMDVQPCRGCFVCFERGEARCPLKDDRDAILEQIAWADGVILASPVYGMHITSLLKQFVDRTSYMFHRPRYFEKYALVVAVAGNFGLKPTLQYLSDYCSGIGFQVVDKLGYTAAPKNTLLKVPPVRKDRTDDALARFYAAIAERKPARLRLMDHIGFRLMQAVYSRLETMSPTDYAYWTERGWLEPKRQYFVENVRRFPFGDALGRLAGFFMGKQMDKASSPQD